MSNNPRDAVIVAAVRTPVTKAKRGGLKDTRPDDLLAVASKGLMARVEGLDPAQVDDVVIGTAMPEGEQGMNVGRIAAMAAGVPASVPAMTSTASAPLRTSRPPQAQASQAVTLLCSHSCESCQSGVNARCRSR